MPAKGDVVTLRSRAGSDGPRQTVQGILVRYSPGSRGFALGGATLRLRDGTLVSVGEVELLVVDSRWAPDDPAGAPSVWDRLRRHMRAPTDRRVWAVPGEYVDLVVEIGSGSYHRLRMVAGRLRAWDPSAGQEGVAFAAATLERPDGVVESLDAGWVAQVWTAPPPPPYEAEADTG